MNLRPRSRRDRGRGDGRHGHRRVPGGRADRAAGHDPEGQDQLPAVQLPGPGVRCLPARRRHVLPARRHAQHAEQQKRRPSRTSSPRCPRTATSRSRTSTARSAGRRGRVPRDVYEADGLHTVADHGAVEHRHVGRAAGQTPGAGPEVRGLRRLAERHEHGHRRGRREHGARCSTALGTKARAKGLWVYGHNHDKEFSTKLPVRRQRRRRQGDGAGPGGRDAQHRSVAGDVRDRRPLGARGPQVQHRRAGRVPAQVLQAHLDAARQGLGPDAERRARSRRRTSRASPTPAARRTSPAGRASSRPRPTSTTTTGSTTSRRTRSPRPRSRSTC